MNSYEQRNRPMPIIGTRSREFTAIGDNRQIQAAPLRVGTQRSWFVRIQHHRGPWPQPQAQPGIPSTGIALKRKKMSRVHFCGLKSLGASATASSENLTLLSTLLLLLSTCCNVYPPVFFWCGFHRVIIKAQQQQFRRA